VLPVAVLHPNLILLLPDVLVSSLALLVKVLARNTCLLW
jgi:hypothetical protein